MKYVRTKDDRIVDITYWLEDEKCYYIYESIDFGVPRTYIYKEEIIKEADNLVELCDEFVYKEFCRLLVKGCRFKQTVSYVLSEGGEVFGAIWTDRGLIYVAKTNKVGEFELL